MYKIIGLWDWRSKRERPYYYNRQLEAISCCCFSTDSAVFYRNTQISCRGGVYQLHHRISQPLSVVVDDVVRFFQACLYV